MSIATQLAALTQIRTDIRTALTGKGISADTHDFADFADDIDDIQTGGGGENDVLAPPEIPLNATIEITEV